jgi:hypothetical protein
MKALTISLTTAHEIRRAAPWTSSESDYAAGMVCPQIARVTCEFQTARHRRGVTSDTVDLQPQRDVQTPVRGSHLRLCHGEADCRQSGDSGARNDAFTEFFSYRADATLGRLVFRRTVQSAPCGRVIFQPDLAGGRCGFRHRGYLASRRLLRRLDWKWSNDHARRRPISARPDRCN